MRNIEEHTCCSHVFFNLHLVTLMYQYRDLHLFLVFFALECVFPGVNVLCLRLKLFVCRDKVSLKLNVPKNIFEKIYRMFLFDNMYVVNA